MITLLWRTDVHLADSPPQSRTDDWTTTILDKVRQIGELTKEVGASAVLDGGDFFHVKSPSRNSHSLVGRAAAAHGGYPCPVYATVGNHDVKYGNLEFLDEAPLGTLFSTGVFRRLYDQHEAVFLSGGLKVRVVGVPYHGTSYDMNRFTGIVRGDEDYLVAIAHVLANKKGGSLFEAEDVLSYEELAPLAPDVWCLGHYHKDQDITRVDGKIFVNVGSVSRGSLSQDDLVRKPAVVALRFSKDGIEAERLDLQVLPSSEVFDLDGKARVEERTSSMEQMVDNLKDLLVMREGESLLDQVRLTPIDDVVRERTIFYLEQAGAK